MAKDTPPVSAPGARVSIDPSAIIAPGAIIGYRKNGQPIRLQAGGAGIGMSEAEIRALPVGVPLVKAGRALLMGRTKSHELARAGDFPIKVLRIGATYVVRKVDLLAYLGLDTDPVDNIDLSSMAS